MNVKKIAFAALLAIGATSAMAADVRLTINGALTDTTCRVGGQNGEFTDTITLPTLSKTALAAAGSTAGRQPINLAISGCEAAVTKATIYFEGGGSNVTSSGGLTNIAQGDTAATNVEIQLLDANAEVLDVNNSKPEYTVADGDASVRLYAQYHSVPGGATAGAVSSIVALSFSYN